MFDEIARFQSAKTQSRSFKVIGNDAIR